MGKITLPSVLKNLFTLNSFKGGFILFFLTLFAFSSYGQCPTATGSGTNYNENDLPQILLTQAELQNDPGYTLTPADIVLVPGDVICIGAWPPPAPSIPAVLVAFGADQLIQTDNSNTYNLGWTVPQGLSLYVGNGAGTNTFGFFGSFATTASSSCTDPLADGAIIGLEGAGEINLFGATGASICAGNFYGDINNVQTSGTGYFAAGGACGGNPPNCTGTITDFNNFASPPPVDPCDPIASGNPDFDGDGVTDICDVDDDNDGVLDTLECPTQPCTNDQDLDSDNDGCSDAAEAGVPQAQGMPTDDFEFNISQGAGNGDENGDGLADVVDRNGNSIPDYQEVGNDTYNLAIDGTDSGACTPITDPDTSCSGTLSMIANPPIDGLFDLFTSAGQSFLANATGDGLIVEASIYYTSSQIPSADLFLEIYNGDTVTGTPAYTQSLDPNNIPNNGSGLSTALAIPFPVTMGNTYTIRLFTTDTANPFRIFVTFNNAYPDGQLYTNGALNPDPLLDLGFEVDICVPPADDMDNVDTAIEDGAPGNGDGNGDGMLDSLQPNVASIPDGSGTGDYVTIQVTGACSQITRMIIEQETDLSSLDADFDYPLGLVDFTLDCVNPGESATIRYFWYGINTAADLDAYRKFGPSTPGMPATNFFTSSFGINVTEDFTSVNGETVYFIEYTLTDGQEGDETALDGEIIDPTGPAIAAACMITGPNVFNQQCNDNGTPTDITDDYITFSMEPSGISSNTYSVTVDNGGTITFLNGNPPNNIAYNTPPTLRLQTGSADGATQYTITLTDDVDNTCFLTEMLAVQNVCSTADPCTDGATAGTVTANDPDADGINNVCDLDDDNDGILDTVEEFGFDGANCTSPSVELIGTNADYVTGTGSGLGTVGAVYRFSNAVPSLNLDVLIELVEISPNANLIEIDAPNANTFRNISFRPRIENTNPQNGIEEYVRFKFSTVESGQNTPLTIESIGFLAGDIDGDIPGNEIVSVFNPSSYTLDANTLLNPQVNGSNVSIASPINANAASEEEKAAFFFYSGGLQEIEFQLGIIGNTGVNPSRLGLVTFGECTVTELPNPVVQILTGNDTDGDGIPNSLDLDSDNDGCNDTIEAGNADPDNDGALGTSPVAVDANGQVTGQGGYIGTTSDVTIFGPDDDNDGIANVCDDDDDNDGVPNNMDICPGGDDTADVDFDGVPDFCDLDNDNDGILDAVECPGVLSVVDFSTLTPAQRSTLSSANGGTVTFDTGIVGASGMNITVGITSSGAPNSINPGIVNLDMATVNNLFDDRRDASGTSGNLITFTYSEPVFFEITSEPHSFFGNDENIRVSSSAFLDGFIDATTTVANVNPTLLSDNGLIDTTGDNQPNYLLTGDNTQNIAFTSQDYAAGTAPGSGTPAGDPEQGNGTFWGVTSNGNTATIFSVEYYRTDVLEIPGREPYRIFIGTCPDSDGDGIVDSFDTDSDNDGCPDAVEAAGAFTQADLTTSNNLADLDEGDVDPATGIPTDGPGGASQQQATTADVNVMGPDTDGDGISDACDLTDDRPEVMDDVATTEAETPVVIDVLDNDPTVPPMGTITISTPPPNGTVTITDPFNTPDDPSDDVVEYTPDPGFSGEDIFEYELCDNVTPTPNCEIAMVTVTVTPVAVDDVINVMFEMTMPFTVADIIANDIGDLDPTTFMVIGGSGPTNGTLTDLGGGNFEYTPNNGFTGTDSFMYQICDTNGSCTTATVDLAVPPAAIDDMVTTPFETPITISVLDNDIPFTSFDLTTLTITTPPPATEGTVTVNPDGTVDFIPAPGFTGTSTFVYEICDTAAPGGGDPCTQATVTVVVTEPPVAVDDESLANAPGATACVPTVANDTDATSGIDPSTVSLVTPPGATSVVLDANGDVTSFTVSTEGMWEVNPITGEICFTPMAGYTLDPTPVMYNVENNDGVPSNDATVTIDYVPVATDDVSNGNTTGDPAVVSVLVNDTNGDTPDPTTVMIVGANPTTGILTVPGEGQWSVTPAGEIVFTPDPGYTGDPADIMYTVEDDEGNMSDPATVTVTYDICNGLGTGDCDGDGTPNNMDPNPNDPCSDNGVIGDEDPTNPIWANADCDGDGTPNGTDPEPYNPCVDNGVTGDEDITNPIYAAADCDGDGDLNGTDPDPNNPCDFTAGTAVPTNPNNPGSPEQVAYDVWAVADCDGDGVTNGVESETDTTNPYDSCSYLQASQNYGMTSQEYRDLDCDGDGVTNGDEIDPDGNGINEGNGTNELDPCDFDKILVTLAQSSAFLIADCDGDGVTNGQELADNTDPQDPCQFNQANQDYSITTTAFQDLDCDGDGVTNGDEIDPTGTGTDDNDGTNPLDPCEYDPASQVAANVTAAWSDLDCDGDGVTNGDELNPPNGDPATDPLDPCSLNYTDQSVAPSAAWIADDCDGDGVTNGQEVTDNTDPTDPCEYDPDSQDTTITSAVWDALDCDGDGVTNGDEIDDMTDPLDPCSLDYTSQSVAPSAAWLADDCDGDGVPNGQEVTDMTDPTDPCEYDPANQVAANVTTAWSDLDCDGDGVTNGDELNPPNGDPATDPLDPCSLNYTDQSVAPSAAWIADDCDGDGVTNGQEVIDNTDPTDPCEYDSDSQDTTITSAVWDALDCDGDGVTNGDEISDGTDPLDPCSLDYTSQSVAPSAAWLADDCDGDGVPNGQEVTDMTDPTDPCEYDPANQVAANVTAAWSDLDCDGDGVTNGDELDDGTDPLDDCSLEVTSQTVDPSQSWIDGDCDGDGVTNGNEVIDGTDPVDPCDFMLENATVPMTPVWEALDCDGDGVTNGDELDDGTDPQDPCDFVVASQTLPTTGDFMLADCDGDGVTNGDEITDGTDPTDPCDFVLTSQTVTPSQEWLDADCDGDGVTNGQEVIDGTDPLDGCSLDFTNQTVDPTQAWLDGDCDGDGVPNGIEIIAGTDPVDPCSYKPINQDPTMVSAEWHMLDCDGDGVTNLDELNDGTNPLDPCDFVLASQTVTTSPAWDALDCDNDGLNNGDEITLGTDPLNEDTDGDGVLDGQEVTDGTDPLDICDFVYVNQTVDPIDEWYDLDCDGDGVINSQEIVDGTDPTDVCSFDCESINFDIVTQEFLDADCDGDGITNGEELNDDDGDGICDLDEDNNGDTSLEIEVFDIMTPNGDGLNDVLTIRGIQNFPNNTVEVYNRWGVLVYNTVGYGQDGKFFRGFSDGRSTINRDEALPVGTYYYILNYVNNAGENKRAAGPFYINRK